MTAAFLAVAAFPLVFVGGYLLFANLFKIIPVHKHFRPTPGGIDIVLTSNGAHTDICLPFQNTYFDWGQIIDLQQFAPTHPQYIAFGWGDKGFYLDTPTWGELKPSVAAKALFGLSRAVMHISLFEGYPPQDKYYQIISISPEQYARLVDYIQLWFDYDEEGQLIRIPFGGLPAYEQLNDNFYEAQSRYHFFKTCNCWVNQVLKHVGIKTALWTPFAPSLFYHYQLEEPPNNSTLAA
ncbi:TIGR02117 family protein [Eisenibacter elegans]|jgi:uncharacterized protein (TIGR02117 family)|uniref:TIGR02117 family protein n=1 Tax=Eisenibacter elegans TaxID=997 RepID=UPI0003F6788E|nr:TIGR02117 family protein [Eisenibacter elegans]